jgi:hypothetical protein
MKRFDKTAMAQLIEFIEINNQAPLTIIYKKAKELLEVEAMQHEKLLSEESPAILTLQKIKGLLFSEGQ